MGVLNKIKEAKERAKRNIKICEDCPFFTPSRTCSLCGCPMDKKVKLLVFSCPDKKW